MSTNRASGPLPGYFRWVVLVIMSLICFASYFIYDSITPLGTLIQKDPVAGGVVKGSPAGNDYLELITPEGKPVSFKLAKAYEVVQKMKLSELTQDTWVVVRLQEDSDKAKTPEANSLVIYDRKPELKEKCICGQILEVKALPKVRSLTLREGDKTSTYSIPDSAEIVRKLQPTDIKEGRWAIVQYKPEKGSHPAEAKSIEISDKKPDSIPEGGLGFSSSEYNLLFSAYAVANVFLLMLLIAGVVVDRLGLIKSGIFYGFLCFLGAALTTLGALHGLPSLLGPLYKWLQTAFLPDWGTGLKIMLLGRAIYGVGAEAILVVNNKALARWFKGKELAFAYGLNLTIMRLGTYFAMTVQSPLSTSWGLQNALWFASVVIFLGFLSFFLYMRLEKVSRGREGAPASTAGAAGPEEKFHLKEVFKFTAPFWFITLLCVTFYSAVFPFQNNAPDILVKKFKYSENLAGFVASFLIFGTMICTPILGKLVDRYGRRATMMMAGSVLLIPCHLLIGLTYFPPVVPIFFVGIALSLVPAALWAAIPMMVPENRLGTAFGVVGYVQNVGLFLFPYLAGLITDAHTVTKTIEGTEVKTVDYTYTMLMFAALGIAGFVFSLLLKQADRRRTDGISIEKVLLK